jgi:pyruvate dehydrogenase E2 component (dihydrolipoamide acetyltransferase)
MPEVAAGSNEAVLSQWLIKMNAAFKAGEPIAVIETDKAVVEVEAEYDATLASTLVEAGSTVEVGSPIALLLLPGEESADVDAVLAELGVAAAGARTNTTADSGTQAPLQQEQQATAASPLDAAQEPERIFASPLARRLLKQAGLSLTDVEGTGPHGRIARKDVERALAARQATTTPETATARPPAAQRAPQAERTVAVAPSASHADAPSPVVSPDGAQAVPHTRLRRAIAARLTQSKQKAPHFYLKTSVHIDALLDLRGEINKVASDRVSVNDFVLKAAAYAHQQVPQMNVVWQDEAMLQYSSADIGVAIASSRGLVTPVIRHVDSLPLGGVARQVRQYAGQADSGRLAQSDLEGGTLTVTNLGMFGVEEFSAIINPPQAAILAVGTGRKQPVVTDEGGLTAATIMRAVLSVDHRAVDGADAARWMKAFTTAIEEPMLLLL